jgi:beta-N-acetylhexosaminidase
MKFTEIERLAAAVLCVGFPGTTIAEVPTRELRELRPGGVILFARNTVDCAQTARLTGALREELGDEGGVPFVAVDQEGGRVVRLRGGVSEIPPMMALGAAGDDTLSERLGAGAVERSRFAFLWTRRRKRMRCYVKCSRPARRAGCSS